MPELRLLAWPAGHSLSPVMHGAALELMGLDHTYRAVAVPPEDLEAATTELRQPDVLGANVTVPHKERIMGLLDSVSAAARTIGAVNTVSNRGGLLHGDNTDVAGFLALLESAGVALPGDRSLRAVIVGAGGAARAAVYALAPHALLTLINRTDSRARALASDYQDLAEFTAISNSADVPLLDGSDLIVNTTTVGMLQDGRDPDESPLPADVLPAGSTVIDMVYRPQETRLMKDARRAGLSAHGGLEMLVQQGAQSLRLWTSVESVPVAAMRQAARTALSGD